MSGNALLAGRTCGSAVLTRLTFIRLQWIGVNTRVANSRAGNLEPVANWRQTLKPSYRPPNRSKWNPCKDVRRNSEKPRDRYVTDAEYQIIYDMAAPWPLVQCAMEFAYLCRMRLCEVLELKKSNILDNGLLIQRRKGSRGNITLWNDRLLTVVCRTEYLPMPDYTPLDPYLIRSQRGDRLTEDGFSTLWQRLMVMAEAKGLERFTFHDLKAKGVSDTKGDKQTASGHRSAAMVDTYNRKLAEVDPAG